MTRALALALALASASGCAGSASYRPTALTDRAPPVAASSPGEAPDADAEPPAPLARARPSLPIPTEVRLANGARLLFLERHELPLVSASLILRFDPEEARTVVPELYAQALKGGSAEFSGRSTRAFLAAAGASASATSGGDTVVVDASMLAPNAEEVLTRLAATFASPALDDAELPRARRALLAQSAWLRQYPNAQAAAQRLLLGEAHPFRLRAFDAGAIRGASRDDLARFERAYLVGENVTVAVVGDFRRAEIERVLEARLGRLPRRARTVAAFREPPAPARARVAIVPWRSAPQSKIAVAFRAPPPRSEDRAALALVREILTASSGRLTRKIRIEEGASYGVAAVIDYWRSGAAFEISSSVEPRHTALAVDAVVREVARLGEELVDDDELARAKAHVAVRWRSSGGSPSAKDLGLLNMIATQDLPLDAFAKLADRVESTTAEDVRAAAARYLRVDRVQIAVAGDPAVVEAPLRALRVADVVVAPPP